MPAPSSYIDVTAFPFSRTVTQTEFNSGTYGNAANEVWFRLVLATKTAVGGYTNGGGTFLPRTQVLQSDGSTNISVIPTLGGVPKGWYFVLAIGTYWIKVIREGGGATDFDFSVSLSTHAIITSIPDGAFIINDDTPGYPATVWTADGTFIGILTNATSGEIGDSLPTGESLWQDFSGYALKLYDSIFNLFATLNTSPALTGPCNIANDGTNFYVLNHAEGTVWKVTTAGVITGPIANLPPGLDYSGFGVKSDATVAYYAEGADSASIHRWGLVNDVALSDFYTIPGFSSGDTIAVTGVNGHPGEILVLADGTIVTWWNDDVIGGPGDFILLHLAADGTLITSRTYSGDYGIIDHIHYAPDNPDGIIIWFFKDSSGKPGRIGHLNLSTGVLAPSFDTPLFAQGINLGGSSSDTIGPSESCTLVTYMYSAPVPSGTGGIPPDNSSICSCQPGDVPTASAGGGQGAGSPPVQTTQINASGTPLPCDLGGLVPTAADLTFSEIWWGYS